MPPTADAARPLAAALRGLSVEVATVRVEYEEVVVPSYDGGPRPSSTILLSGAGSSGFGEHVGWTQSAHAGFRDRAHHVLPPGTTTIGALSQDLRRRCSDPYDRAAIEAAAIDLALHQAGLSLAALIDGVPRDTRYVISFSAVADPVEQLTRDLDSSPGVQAKIDVAPSWSKSVFEALCATQRVAVLDWKRTGTPQQHEMAHRILPAALLEDPGPEPCASTPAIASRRSIDGPFRHARALEAAAAPFAANVKPARMGGVLEALDGITHCARRGIQIYFGGMFEMGPGRLQLLALASLLAPEGPNDIAPISRTTAAIRPPVLRPPIGAGFGGRPGQTTLSDPQIPEA